MTATLHRLAASGFVDDLVADGTTLFSRTTGKRYDVADLRSGEIVRFEGDSDPDDEAIVVAITTADGTALGTFTTPYGPGASAEEAQALRRLLPPTA
ncbi:MAG: hypothetical protein WA964_03615 [Ilumatobacter sp.]|uniref:hypothetical protein n=1 Tax=Ilumatobacter sp. TaxID=1967498 RepID=UPI003C722EA3